MELFFDVNEHYAKDAKLKREDVQTLQEWAKKQPHLPKNISEAQFLYFLHCCYYKLEASKTTIENYFTVRTHIPEIFNNRNVKEAVYAGKTSLVAALPKKSPEGYTIIFTKLLDTTPEKYNYEKTMMFFDMLSTCVIATEGPQNGHILVIDSAGVTLGHILRVNIFLAKKFMFYLQDAFPVRLKAVHLLNFNAIGEKMLGLLKAFINPEIFELLHFHSTMDSFFKYLPQEYMPEEYGGRNSNIKDLQRNFENIILKNEAYFKEEEKQVVDESKRIGKSRFLDDMGDVGVDGSFKKLDID